MSDVHACLCLLSCREASAGTACRPMALAAALTSPPAAAAAAAAPNLCRLCELWCGGAAG
jgi:hypothetical protein